MDALIQKAAEILKKARRVTVLTGAGISAESGIPTYRGSGGIWNKFKAEDLAAPDAFARDPVLIWKWYGERQQTALQCQPNPGHDVIAKMEKRFPVFSLITQNIDNMHQRAGSTKVLELHGNLFKARCVQEGSVIDFVLGDEPLPKCKDCGAILRPHIVWFGEMLDPEVLRESFQLSVDCDAFLLIGTSAQVQPAASLPVYASGIGAKVIEINMEKTHITPYAEVSLQGASGEILPKIWEILESA